MGLIRPTTVPPDRNRSGFRRAPRAGFTFLEILIVMAVMGILMGVGIGYLQNIGAASRVDQARAILRETVFACKQSSNGGTRAMLDLRLRERDNALVVGAAVSRPVLTHNFEAIDSTSHDYPLDIEGVVEVVENGHIGRAAKFEGGHLAFELQSAFAMTDGLLIDVWLLPAEGSGTMSLVEGEGAYELKLVKDQRLGGYDVVLSLQLKDSGRGRTVNSGQLFQTKGGPVKAAIGWVHLQVSYDGADASIRVNGLEHETRRLARRRGKATASEEAGHRRLTVPEGGAVRLILGGSKSPYVGLMDTLVLGGIFRSSDMERELFGLTAIPEDQLPVRVTYRNGRLDSARHTGDVILYLVEDTNTHGPRLEVRLGRYGTVDDRLVAGDER